jgi:peptidoglycan/xylan/chitin deacetylase (PgdA/CDA1 family)
MYHKVGQPVHSPQDTFLNVPAESFRRQMCLMLRLGYRPRTFHEVVEALIQGKSLPARSFAVTFDDGYACVGDYAAPVLQELQVPATVFVVSGAAGQTNAWDEVNQLPVLPLMGWERLRSLHAAGWEIGGHTRTHPHLNAISEADALANIREGKEETEAQLGCALTTFCYPFGHYNAQTPALVREAGFLGACTTKSGIASARHDPFLLPRVKIASRDGVVGLLYRLLVRPYLPG